MRLPEELLRNLLSFEAWCLQFPHDARVEVDVATALFGVMQHEGFRSVEVLDLEPMETRRVTLPDGRHALVHRRAVN